MVHCRQGLWLLATSGEEWLQRPRLLNGDFWCLFFVGDFLRGWGFRREKWGFPDQEGVSWKFQTNSEGPWSTDGHCHAAH